MDRDWTPTVTFLYHVLLASNAIQPPRMYSSMHETVYDLIQMAFRPLECMASKAYYSCTVACIGVGDSSGVSL